MALDWLMRQAGSSPQALCRSLGRAIGEEKWPDEDLRELCRIQELASRLRSSSKGEQLGDMLSSHSGKVVVFTEFAPTLDHLAEVCERRAISYARFSGDLPRSEKDELDAPWCEKCAVAARPLLLCEAMHCLCKDCFAACAQCGRLFCRVCQPRCKCGR